eukprot:3956783-Amphidinium_carterae.2
MNTINKIPKNIPATNINPEISGTEIPGIAMYWGELFSTFIHNHRWTSSRNEPKTRAYAATVERELVPQSARGHR